MADRH